MSARPPPHPPWYRIYSRVTSVAWLTFIVLRHAHELLMAHQLAKRERREAELREVLRFEEDDGPDAAAAAGDAADDASLESVESVDGNATLAECLRIDARRVFGVPSLRPKQEDAITTIVADPKCKGKLIVVDRTGGGKSLILYLTAFAVSGITLVIVPLLSLTANQMARIESAAQRYCTSEAHHLDDLPSSVVEGEIIPRMDGLDPGSSTTIFCFCSPQYIVKDSKFRAALLRAHSRRVLRLEFEWKDSAVIFAVARDAEDRQRFKNRLNWEGIEFRGAARGTKFSWAQFVSAHS